MWILALLQTLRRSVEFVYHARLSLSVTNFVYGVCCTFKISASWGNPVAEMTFRVIQGQQQCRHSVDRIMTSYKHSRVLLSPTFTERNSQVSYSTCNWCLCENVTWLESHRDPWWCKTTAPLFLYSTWCKQTSLQQSISLYTLGILPID